MYKYLASSCHFTTQACFLWRPIEIIYVKFCFYFWRRRPSLDSNTHVLPGVGVFLDSRRECILSYFMTCWILYTPHRAHAVISVPLFTDRKGEERRAQERWRQRGRPQEEEAAAAEDSLHQPAAAGAGGHVPEEPLPGHEHQGGDRGVDEPDRGQSAGKKPADRPRVRKVCVTRA